MTTKTITAKTKKAAAANKAAKKTSYDPAKAKAQREARKAKKAKALSIATKRQAAVDAIAKLAISDDITGDDLIEQIQPLRAEIEACDSEMAALVAKAKTTRGDFNLVGSRMLAAASIGDRVIGAEWSIQADGDFFHGELTVSEPRPGKATTVIVLSVNVQSERLVEVEKAMKAMFKSQKAVAKKLTGATK